MKLLNFICLLLTQLSDLIKVVYSHPQLTDNGTLISRQWNRNHFNVTIEKPDEEDLFTVLKLVTSFWGQYSCIDFNFVSADENPVLAFVRGENCTADDGVQNATTRLVIYINDSCSSARHLQHFLGHFLGLEDEQRRPDRDEYIEVVRNDLTPSEAKLMSKLNHSEVDKILYSTVYDISSVMHTGPRTMGEGGNRAIFRTKDPKFRGMPGRVFIPSHWDLFRVTSLYGCHEIFQKECGLSGNPCQNGGYVGFYCDCLCPHGTTGQFCESAVGDYYDKLWSPCLRNVNETNSTISTDDVQFNSTKVSWCLFQVKAPEEHTIEITFTFTKLPAVEETPIMSCQGSLLSITEAKLESSEKIICGEDLQELDVYWSKTNEVEILYDVRNLDDLRTLTATVIFHHERLETNITTPQPLEMTSFQHKTSTTLDYFKEVANALEKLTKQQNARNLTTTTTTTTTTKLPELTTKTTEMAKQTSTPIVFTTEASKSSTVPNIDEVLCKCVVHYTILAYFFINELLFHF